MSGAFAGSNAWFAGVPWRQSDRNLLAMSLANGTVSAIGQTHAANVYAGQATQGFTVAPVCP